MKTRPLAPPGYDTKAGNYFEWPRAEMLPFVPSNCRRLLDIGCGTGSFGGLLKKTREIEVWGVEPVRSAAEKASAELDHVINGPFDASTELPIGTFDCVVFNDVLEHMVTPEEALQYAKTLLVPRGVIVASIPNIQYLGVAWQLLFHGNWEYVDAGVLDKTHLRFFTKSSIEKLFQNEGYAVESICGINPYGSPPWVAKRMMVVGAYKVANALFLGRFADMKFAQFAVVARTAHPPNGRREAGKD